LAYSELWFSLTTNKNVVDKWFVLSKASDLFGEAIRCFYAHANLACCICARASMETLLHTAKTTPTISDCSASHELVKNTEWSENFEWAKRSRLIDENFAKRIEIARQHGNLGAHLAQRMDRAYYEQAHAIRTLEPVQLWVTDEEAWNDLVTCRDLIIRIATQRWENTIRPEGSPG
jgi:hypothetical protein